MGEPDQEEGASRVEQARRRARRERQQRLEQGLEELQKLRPSKPRARVSVSEPEARRMRQLLRRLHLETSDNAEAVSGGSVGRALDASGRKGKGHIHF
jgi:hypothetical protein